MSDQHIERALALLQAPAKDVWRRTSDRVLQQRGAGVYDAPLIPGFEETRGEDILLLPTPEQLEAQIAAGEVPHYVQDPKYLELREALAKAKRLASTLAKVAYEMSWEGPDVAMEPWHRVSNPEPGKNYSEARERHVSDGVDIAWHGNQNADRESTTPEPPLKNYSLHGGPR